MTEAIRAALEPDPVPDTVSTTAPTTAMARGPRFAQLTYASFHREDGAGGWQVKDALGDLDPAEQRALTARIGTRLAPATRLPTLPTPEERRGLPRRLVHAATTGGAHAFWHTIPAGADSSGRPGNVFAHVVLDRRPTDPEPALRPSDLFSAPQWRTPYGSVEVLASSLDGLEDPPWDGPHTAESVVPFLVDAAMDRPAVLATLLDAVADALRHGPPVVLGVDDPQQAERWIAGVLHLMSPGTARGVFFSTAERPDALAGPLSIHIAVVPRDALAELDASELVLLDLDADAVDLGDLEGGQPHRTRYGSDVPVGPWSVLALEVLQDVDLARRTLAEADTVAAAVGDRGLPPGWPLAMAVSLAPTDLPDAQAEARVVLAACAPAGLRRTPELERAHRRALLGPLGPTTADAWAAASGQVAGVDRGIAAAVYLERALDDDGWLTRAGGAPAPAAPPGPDDDWTGRVRAALTRAAVPEAPVLERAVRLLRVVDLVVRAQLADVAEDPIVDEVVGPLLTDPADGPALAASVGSLSEPLAGVLVACAEQRLAVTDAPPGERMSPAVLRWLHPRAPSPPALGTIGSPATSRVLTEIAVQATSVLSDPSAFRALALADAVRRVVQDDDPAALSRLAAGKPFTTSQLRPLAQVYGLHPLAELLPAALRTSADLEDLSLLVDLVRDTVPVGATGVLGEARRIAEVRFLAAEGVAALPAGSVGPALVETLQIADALLVRPREAPPAAVARWVTLALVVDLVDAARGPLGEEGSVGRQGMADWLDRASARRDRAARLRSDLTRVLSDGVVGEVELGASSLATAVGLPSSDPEVWRRVVGSGRDSAVDALLTDRLERRDAEAVEEFLGAVEQAVSRRVGDPRRLPSDLDPTARAIWHLAGPPPRPRFGRSRA